MVLFLEALSLVQICLNGNLLVGFIFLIDARFVPWRDIPGHQGREQTQHRRALSTNLKLRGLLCAFCDLLFAELLSRSLILVTAIVLAVILRVLVGVF